MKKLISILLSLLMVLSLLPMGAISAFAATTPSTKKTASSVAAVSSYYIYDLYSGDKCYYFDDLQEAFDYLNEDPYNLCTVTLLKDVELEEAITFTDLAEGCYGEKDETYKILVELDGHTVTAPNGNAFEFNDMWVNVFVNAYKQAFDGGDCIDGYGAIYAKDYAFSLKDSLSLVISGGTYSTETKDAPFYVDDSYEGICNIRQSAIIKTDNLVYNEGFFGNEGNVYLRHVDDDHFAYFHVLEKEVDGKDAYVMEEHSFVDTTTIAPDRQSATIDRKCSVCEYVSKSQNAVALIGDKGYLSVAAAFMSIKENETATIEVLGDTKVATSLTAPKGSNVTFELNGHTIDHTAGYFIVNGANVEVKNGTINSTSNMTFIMKGIDDSSVEDYSHLKIDNAKVINQYGTTGLCIFLDNPLTNWSKPVNQYGIKVDVNDSTISATGVAVSVNGNYANIDNRNVLNFTNSECISENAPAMFISGYTEVNLTNTKVVGTASGIEIRAGILNVLGDDNEIISTYDGPLETEPNHSGTTTTGAAVAVAQHTLQPNPNPVEVNIYGGKLVGTAALNEENVENLVPEQVDVTINIYGGDFEGKALAVAVENEEDFITGGTFTTKPDEAYIAQGYAAFENLDGTFTVKPIELDFTAFDAAVDTANSIAKVGYTKESVDALEATLVDRSKLKSQEAIDNATSDIQTAISNLEAIVCNVTFNVEDENGYIDSTTYEYRYGETAIFDATEFDGYDVSKWTVEADGSSSKITTNKKIVYAVIHSDSIYTVYLQEDKTVENSSLVKYTYLSKNNAVVDIVYDEPDASASPEATAPHIPFYDFVGWDKVSDTSFKAVYEYNDHHCQVIGNATVLVNNKEEDNVPYDDIVTVTNLTDGRIALSSDGTEANIITYLDNQASFHCPKTERIYVISVAETKASIGVTGFYHIYDESKDSVSINAQYFLPEGCTFVECGAIYTANSRDVKVKSTIQNSNHEYTITLKAPLAGIDEVGARAYIVYTDENGDVQTIESDSVTVQLVRN